MIAMAISMLGLCFVSLVICCTVYLSGAQAQTERTKRLEIEEASKRLAYENVWLAEANRKEELALKRGVQP